MCYRGTKLGQVDPARSSVEVDPGTETFHPLLEAVSYS